MLRGIFRPQSRTTPPVRRLYPASLSRGKISIGSRRNWRADLKGYGLSQAPAEGLWRQGAESDSDDIVIFEVMTEEVDLADWHNRRAELERRFRQDKVIIRYMPMALV
jgi:hypothetical protein